MKLKYFIILFFMSIFCLSFSFQLSAQQYYKVVEGNDNPATVEKISDDVNIIDDMLTIYKIDISKTIPSKENYVFWVDFMNNNKLPIKRKEIIYSLLKQMKTQLK